MAYGFAAAHVVDPAGPSPLDDGLVGPDRVADVGQVAPRVEVADHDHRFLKARLDARDLAREAGREERRVLSRPDVVEGSGDDDRQAELVEGAQRHPLLGELAESVWVGRADGRILVERAIRRTVDQRRAGHEDPWREAGLAEGGQQVPGAKEVHLERLARSVPRLADVRGARQVVDPRRLRFDDGARDRFPIEQVDADPRHRRFAVVHRQLLTRAAPADEPVGPGGEAVEQMAAGEPGGAGDEDRVAHGDSRKASGRAQGWPSRAPYCC